MKIEVALSTGQVFQESEMECTASSLSLIMQQPKAHLPSLQRSPSSSTIMGASDAIVFYILDPLFLLKGTVTSILVNSDSTVRVSRA